MENNLNYEYSVRQIQAALLALSRVYDNILRVNVDGIYGDETKNSVLSFQKEFFLPLTGDVDLETWKKLFSEYDSAKESLSLPKSIMPYNTLLEGQSLSPGDASDTVMILQIMLHTLGIEYTSIDALPITGKYDENTQRAVSQVQKTLGIDETGYADIKFWNLLSELYNKYGSYN